MKKVCILMATHNGEKFLSAQLDSFLRQSHNNWELCVSDDNSTDGTMKILENFAQCAPNKVTIKRKNYGNFVLNFTSMVSEYEGDADYFAFSDQDDVWEEEKLSVAVRQLEKMASNKPLLYCSRTELVDANANPFNPRQYSTSTLQCASFSNALVETIAGGNTMVFNKLSAELLKKFGVVRVSSHDWWIYMLVTGAGGEVFFDSWPSLKYRQHGDNTVGGKKSIKKRFIRFWNGNFKKEIDKNILALQMVDDVLTKKNSVVLRYFTLARSSKNIFSRIKYFYLSNVYRKKIIYTLALFLGFIFKKC